MYNRPDYVEAGGPMTYGVNLLDLDRRAATYVDKTLKGAKPADLPVEQPKKFEFIILTAELGCGLHKNGLIASWSFPTTVPFRLHLLFARRFVSD